MIPWFLASLIIPPIERRSFVLIAAAASSLRISADVNSLPLFARLTRAFLAASFQVGLAFQSIRCGRRGVGDLRTKSNQHFEAANAVHAHSQVNHPSLGNRDRSTVLLSTAVGIKSNRRVRSADISVGGGVSSRVPLIVHSVFGDKGVLSVNACYRQLLFNWLLRPRWGDYLQRLLGTIEEAHAARCVAEGNPSAGIVLDCKYIAAVGVKLRVIAPIST